MRRRRLRARRRSQEPYDQALPPPVLPDQCAVGLPCSPFTGSTLFGVFSWQAPSRAAEHGFASTLCAACHRLGLARRSAAAAWQPAEWDVRYGPRIPSRPPQPAACRSSRGRLRGLRQPPRSSGRGGDAGGTRGEWPHEEEPGGRSPAEGTRTAGTLSGKVMRMHACGVPWRLGRRGWRAAVGRLGYRGGQGLGCTYGGVRNARARRAGACRRAAGSLGASSRGVRAGSRNVRAGSRGVRASEQAQQSGDGGVSREASRFVPAIAMRGGACGGKLGRSRAGLVWRIAAFRRLGGSEAPGDESWWGEAKAARDRWSRMPAPGDPRNAHVSRDALPASR